MLFGIEWVAPLDWIKIFLFVAFGLSQVAIGCFFQASLSYRRLYLARVKQYELKIAECEALKAAIKICAICPMREEEEQEAIQLARQLH